ncbi:hypothetical protein K7X08_005641 [Anisodus acutangulus]|uniref:CS domain-containing protein n=1 Tax=Anisodus acutangulus TaxID=402998 RepID=A0A9Q1LSS8_9SOLA|nr:hypothetical protein K7X08_005641 [Anisodus acutangulus]
MPTCYGKDTIGHLLTDIKIKSIIYVKAEAVADANKAIEKNLSMAKAYLREGLACMKLEEYQTAKAALETGASLAPGESRFTSLIIECDERIAVIDIVAAVPRDTQMAFNLSNEGTPAVKPKYRHEFYQKPEEVVVTIFAKGIPAKNVSVDFGEQILSVSIDIPGVDALGCSVSTNVVQVNEKIGIIVLCLAFTQVTPVIYEVMSTKIEIRLAKAEPIHWTSLEYTREVAVVQMPNVSLGTHAYL